MLCRALGCGSIGVVGITVQQLTEMQNRLRGVRRPVPACAPGGRLGAMGGQEVILGIDPSLRGTGYGVVRTQRSRAEALAHGTIQCPAGWPRSRCFLKIAEELRQVLKQYRPTVCVVEALFYAQNLQTALILGEARGAALLTVAEAGLDIYEIAPRKVKQAIVGYGAAQKVAVAKMVQRMLNLVEMPSPDAADALAVALTRAQERTRYGLSPPRRL